MIMRCIETITLIFIINSRTPLVGRHTPILSNLFSEPRTAEAPGWLLRAKVLEKTSGRWRSIKWIIYFIRTTSCWNCGRPHNVQAWDKPKAEKKIQASREQFLKNRASKPRGGTKNVSFGGGNGKNPKTKQKWKWSPSEASENGKRSINGKTYTYDKGFRRWVAPNQGTAPSAHLNSKPTQEPSKSKPKEGILKNKPPTKNPSKENRISVPLANVSKQINSSLTNLADQFLDDNDEEDDP
jgi:hypothetical protein